MALAIDSEECTVCGECEPLCPTKAISYDETLDTFVIEAKQCNECEGFFDVSQCVEVCPIYCIYPAAPTPPIPTVKRAKLFNMVIGSYNRPDSTSFN